MPPGDTPDLFGSGRIRCTDEGSTQMSLRHRFVYAIKTGGKGLTRSSPTCLHHVMYLTYLSRCFEKEKKIIIAIIKLGGATTTIRTRISILYVCNFPSVFTKRNNNGHIIVHREEKNGKSKNVLLHVYFYCVEEHGTKNGITKMITQCER